jgi:hypothetical protein
MELDAPFPVKTRHREDAAIIDASSVIGIPVTGHANHIPFCEGNLPLFINLKPRRFTQIEPPFLSFAVNDLHRSVRQPLANTQLFPALYAFAF